MLHRDYLLEVIQQFVSTVSRLLMKALVEHDLNAAAGVEAAIGELVQLDPDTAMSLAPESLVTMMVLSGTGDAVAGYAGYALMRLSEAYAAMGETELAEMRAEQAYAIADGFGADLNEIPEELRDVEARLRKAQESGEGAGA
jgi:hypothetical protein